MLESIVDNWTVIVNKLYNKQKGKQYKHKVGVFFAQGSP